MDHWLTPAYSLHFFGQLMPNGQSWWWMISLTAADHQVDRHGASWIDAEQWWLVTAIAKGLFRHDQPLLSILNHYSFSSIINQSSLEHCQHHRIHRLPAISDWGYTSSLHKAVASAIWCGHLSESTGTVATGCWGEAWGWCTHGGFSVGSPKAMVGLWMVNNGYWQWLLINGEQWLLLLTMAIDKGIINQLLLTRG